MNGLMALGQEEFGARAQGLGDHAPNSSWPWALSHEPWGMSQERWDMSHELLTINNRFINEFILFVIIGISYQLTEDANN